MHGIRQVPEVSRKVFRVVRVKSSFHGAAALVSKHEHQPYTELYGRILHASGRGSIHHVPGNPDHKEIAQPFVEHDLGWHPGVSTAQNDGEGVLGAGNRSAAGGPFIRVRSPGVDIAAIAVYQAP